MVSSKRIPVEDVVVAIDAVAAPVILLESTADGFRTIAFNQATRQLATHHLAPLPVLGRPLAESWPEVARALRGVGQTRCALPGSSLHLGTLLPLGDQRFVLTLAAQEDVSAAPTSLGEDRFRDFAESASDWLWETDRDHRFTFVSNRQRMNLPPLTGMRRWEVPAFSPESTSWEDHIALLEAHIPFRNFELRIARPGQPQAWVSVSGIPRFDAEGSFLGYRGAARDITGEKTAERDLALAAQVFEATADGILICNAAQHVVAVNRAFLRIAGFVQDQVIGRNPLRLVRGTANDETAQRIGASLTAEGRWQGELACRRGDGGEFLASVAVVAVEDRPGGRRKNDGGAGGGGGGGGGINYIVAVNDITERRANEDKILFHANFDALTGLPNRRLFHDRLEQALIRARTEGHRMALLFLDLDGFKYINDTLGHAAGDELLVEVAQRLRRCVRDVDTVARLGGDEFVVALAEIDDASDVAQVGWRILQELRRPVVLGAGEVTVTTSIGASMFPDDGTDAEMLQQQADAAMYAAKARGKNDMAFFTPALSQRSTTRLRLENLMRRSLDRGEFQLHFQPKVDLRSGSMVGAEALCRWNHPEQGLVSPNDFIAVAEDSGLIVALGDWVLRETCRRALEWEASGRAPIRFAVNVSPQQFIRGSFLQALDRVLVETGLPPQSLEIELTEGTLMTEPATVASALRAIRKMGVHVAIDDFGTGYSSLGYLTRLPLDSLKIDQSFVRNLTAGSDESAIASSIIGIAHSLRLRAVAEGVETEAQVTLLRDSGCDEAQGYFFSRPVPFDELLGLDLSSP